MAALLERALDALIARERKRRFAVKTERTAASTAAAGANAPKPTTELAPARVAAVAGQVAKRNPNRSTEPSGRDEP
jgi:hypothetical protein